MAIKERGIIPLFFYSGITKKEEKYVIKQVIRIATAIEDTTATVKEKSLNANLNTILQIRITQEIIKINKKYNIEYNLLSYDSI